MLLALSVPPWKLTRAVPLVWVALIRLVCTVPPVPMLSTPSMVVEVVRSAEMRIRSSSVVVPAEVRLPVPLTLMTAWPPLLFCVSLLFMNRPTWVALFGSSKVPPEMFNWLYWVALPRFMENHPVFCDFSLKDIHHAIATEIRCGGDAAGSDADFIDAVVVLVSWR